MTGTLIGDFSYDSFSLALRSTELTRFGAAVGNGARLGAKCRASCRVRRQSAEQPNAQFQQFVQISGFERNAHFIEFG